MNFKYIGGEIPWSLPFGDHFHSADSQKAAELEIVARRHGFEQLITSQNHSKWSNAGVYFTNEPIDSNLSEHHLTDFNDGHNHTFCYLCSVSPHVHERIPPRDKSLRRKLIPYKNPKARLSSSLDRLDKHSSADLVSYRFVVRTGKEKNSGTRAQVYLYIYGTEKNWSCIHLHDRANSNSSTSIDGFPSGSSRTFCLKGPDIGQLHHLNVNLVGSRSDKEWFLKEIEVTNLTNGTTWLCEFNCWLPKTSSQKVDEVNLNSSPRHKDSSCAIYILQIRTGDKAFAGTDANIYITIHGSENRTNRLRLTSDRVNLFEQNQLDTFAIVGEHLGDLLEISLELDSNKFTSDWYIKEMAIWKIIPSKGDHQSHAYFPINNWLGKKVTILKSKRETYPLMDRHLKGPICYRILVKTGKAMNAGTDANVFLIIYGQNGRTAVHQLNNRSKNDFERNTSSEFTIMDIDIGGIRRIKIWHDNSNPNSAWFLDSVLIEKQYSTCQIISDVYIQRLEQISRVIYRQMVDGRQKRHSFDRQNLRINDEGSNDRLGSGRGILRSPTTYDRASFQKKVTWDEQSIGSQDDLYSLESQRTRSLQNINEQKHKSVESSHRHVHPNDYQVIWVSSHSYKNDHWTIKSIEEGDSFDLDHTTRSLLLSDRAVVNNKMKQLTRENHDEFYEFQANRWLAKDKEDGKLEVYLTPTSTRGSSVKPDASIDLKKKPPIPSSQRFDIPRHKYDHTGKDSKHLSSSDLAPVERSSPNIANSANAMNDGDEELLAKLTGQPLRRPSSSIGSLSPLSQSVKSPRNIDEQRSSMEISRKPPIQSRSTVSSLRSSSQNLTNDRSTPLRHSRNSLTRTSDDSPSNAQLTPRLNSSSSSRLKTSLNTSEELLAQLTEEPIPRTRASAALNQRNKSPRNEDEPPDYFRSLTNSHLKSSQNNNHLSTSLLASQDSFDRSARERLRNSPTTLVPTLPSNEHTIPARHHNELTSSRTNDQDQLARITTSESVFRPRSSATSLSPLSQREKSTRSIVSPLHSSIHEREVSTRIPSGSSNYPRASISSLSPSNQLSKQGHSNNESTNVSSITSSTRSLLRPKSARRSNPLSSSQKSIFDQVYNSAYGTAAASDDF
ncbi:unnamed protein product [Adineta ricciae]|uniref:PLAT domain-containing protein n=1 Tax=Adineta ricciae TaxID=249248 RepID=A0A814SA77_ADIRI|nr:unnamed protein product [Adineta ricciae]CAF1581865.1 unnamed protein product [Adineta ricciae]